MASLSTCVLVPFVSLYKLSPSLTGTVQGREIRRPVVVVVTLFLFRLCPKYLQVHRTIQRCSREGGGGFSFFLNTNTQKVTLTYIRTYIYIYKPRTRHRSEFWIHQIESPRHNNFENRAASEQEELGTRRGLPSSL